MRLAFLYSVCTGNYVHDMQDSGMALMESMDADIHDNTFEDVKYGIRLSLGCARNRIYRNTFATCSDCEKRFPVCLKELETKGLFFLFQFSFYSLVFPIRFHAFSLLFPAEKRVRHYVRSKLLVIGIIGILLLHFPPDEVVC